MRARHEITKKFAKQYQAATKKDKGKLLDEVCSITGGPETTPGDS